MSRKMKNTLVGLLIFLMGFCLAGLLFRANNSASTDLNLEDENLLAVLEVEEVEESEKRMDEVEEVEKKPSIIEENIGSGEKEFGLLLSNYEMRSSKVGRGEFFATIMEELGLTQKEIYDISTKCEGIFDLRQIRVGNMYHAFFSKDESPSLVFFVYERDSESYAIIDVKNQLVEIKQKEFDTEIHYADVIINNSLWLDVQNAGATPLLALELSEIYAWTIDFFGLQKGDSFNAIYETKSYKGEIVDVSKVLFVEFIHLKTPHKAYYFQEEGTTNVYWNEKGESTQKTFLKSPLNFSRISSGFTYARRHPITRQVRPHTGIDYAAPTGTPVWSIGDGVVVEKKYTAAGGHPVTIKHNSVYKSAYLHLSRYGKGIAVGARVTQKQIIGYVGSTGYSTGPHLDFRVWKNGTPINPLRMESPPSHPIKEENLAEFNVVKKDAVAYLNKEYAKNALNKMLEFL